MAEPISWSAIIIGAIDVVGTVVGIVSSILSFVSWGLFILVFVLKIVIDVLKYVANTLLQAALVPWQGIVGWIFMDTEEFFEDMEADHFDDIVPIHERTASGFNPLLFLTWIFEEIREIVVDTIVYLTPLITAIPVIIILGLFLTVVVLIGWWLTPYAFIIASMAYTSFITTLFLIRTGMNWTLTFVSINAPVVNVYVNLFVNLAEILFSLICSGTPYTGDPAHDCPLLYAFYVFFVTEWEMYWALIQSMWALVVQMWNDIGNSLCPNGNCDTSLCQRYLGIPSCTWGFNFAVHMFTSIFTQLATVFFYAMTILFFFGVTVLTTTITKLSFLVSALVTGTESQTIQDAASAFGAATGTLDNLQVPANFQGLKDLFVAFKNMIGVVEDIFVEIVQTISGIVDSIFCYIFRAPIDCGLAKMCYSIFYDISVPLFPGLPPSKLNPVIQIPLRSQICQGFLNINPYSCPYKCDYCPVQFFGIPVPSEPFFTYANQIHMGNKNAKYGYIPCDVKSGCCNPGYTLLSLFLHPT